MLSYTHYYIILGEFGIGILSATLTKQFPHGIRMTVFLIGTADGVGTFIYYAIADGLMPGQRISAPCDREP